MQGIQGFMSTDVITVEPTTTVLQAAERMTDHHLGALVVVSDGKLTGMFTERDVLDRVVSAGLDPSETPVAEVATKNPVSVRPESTVLDCYKLFKTRSFRHLPVVDGEGKPVGVLSVRDFFEHMAVKAGPDVDIDEMCRELGKLSGLMSGVESLR